MMMKITKTRAITERNGFGKFATICCLILFSFLSFGQTNPTAYDLSLGSWTLTGWNSAVAASSYPGNGATGANATTGVVAGVGNGNMMFWKHGSGDPLIATLANANYTGTYVSGSGKVYGNGTSGIGFDNTGGVGIGSAVLAINTTGRSNIQVSWTGRTIATGARTYGIRLMYRVGTTGAFLDANATSSNIFYPAAASVGSTAMPTVTLPSAVNNAGTVQLMWFYYNEATTTSGTRPTLGLDEITVSSSAAAPTINGTIAANEYGVHTNGSNQQSSATGTWYMSSDATNLYIGISGANTAEGAVLYLDKNPITPVNGGTNTDGNLVGYNYDGSNFANLQFRADLVVYFKDSYQEYRTANGTGGWSAATTTGMTYASTAGTAGTREIAIPWSAIGGQPTAYNWFGYVAYTGGGAYASVPTENPGSGVGLIIGSSARWSRYYTVSTSATLPFSRNSYTFTNASSATNFGSISVWDFTMNSSGLFLSRTGNVTGNWTIGGNLTVGNGTIYLGSGGTGYGTTSIAGNLNLLGGTFDMDATTGAVSVTGNVSIASGATLKLSTAVGGDLNVAGNWTNNGTFTPSTRLVQFNGTTAQTLTGATTFGYMKMNNSLGLTLNNPITVNTNLDLTSGKITLGTNNLTLGSAANTSNQSATSYIVTNSTGALVRNSVGNTATPFPVGLVASYTPLTVTNTGTSNNLSLVVTSPPSNAVSDATKIVNLEWNLNSAGTGSVANITFNWNTPSNVGTSYSATGTGELGNYTTGPNYAITNIGTMAGVSKLVNGVALSSGSNKLVLGNTNAVYAVPPSNDNCSGATAITLDAAAITGNVTNATQSLPAITCTTTGTANDDVWYSFTTNGAGTYTITVVGSTSFDAVVDVRSGACNGTNIFCADATASAGTETISATGLLANTTYYIRVYDYASGVPTTRTFTIAVTSPPPTLTVSPTSLAFSTTQAPLTQSASQSFNLSGGQLTGAPGSITVTAPSTDFQVSNDNSTWGSSTTIAYSSATLSATPVYVRFTPQSSGAKSGNVTFSGGGVTTPPTVALTGTAVLPTPVATAATNITATPSFDANWNSVTGASSGYLLDVSASSTFGTTTPATLSEGFETGMPTVGYSTGSYALGSGAWSLVNVLKATGTNVNTGSGGCQIQGGTSASATSPALNNIGTLTFYAKRGATATNLTVNKVISGVPTLLQTITLTTTWTQYTINVNDTGSATQIQFSNGAAVAYVDDVSIGYINSVPDFVTGYNAKPISGQATVTSAVNTNLVADTVYYYRLRATDGTPSAYSNVITVYPVSRGGTVSADQTICSGSQPASLNLSGHYGTILRWESSADAAFTSPTTISNTTTTLSGASIGALTTTTYFRAVVQSGTNPSANSSYVTITVNPTTVGGSVTGGASVCSGSTSGVLTLSGHTGNVVRWESSVSPFTSWTTIANTSTTYTSGALTQTTQFRAVVQSGVCAEVNSSPSTVTISTTTWDGTTWDNGTPTATTAAVINGNYSSTSNGGSITACSLTVNSGFAVVIASGDSVVLSGSLTNNGTFTLENNANLLQGGTTNSNSGAITVNRNSSALLRLDYTLWSSPVASQYLLSFSPNTLTNRFYTYNTNTNLYNAISSPSTTSFDTAKGYLIRVPNNHPSVTPTVYNGVFAGVPNNGNITFTMVDGGAGQRFNAVGNPYPSPIDAVDFVTGNSNITGTLYFWRKTNNTASPSYCTWTTGGFVSNNEAQVYDPNDVIQTGQGFFVEANGSGTSLSFDNNMRIDNHANQFFRVANTLEKHRIWLNVTNGAGLFSQTMIGYIENATNGFDAAIDGRYINDGEVALTTMIDNVDYAIQGKSLPFDATDVVPLKLTVTTAGNYTISLDHVDGLFSASQDVFLRDNQTGFVQDLKAGNYSFTSDAGTFASRFDVIYQSPLGVETPSLNNQLVVYKNEVGDFVINSGSIEMKSVKVFDLRGRLLNEYSGINATQAKVSGGSANGVLLLQITSVDGVTVTRKVVR